MKNADRSVKALIHFQAWPYGNRQLDHDVSVERLIMSCRFETCSVLIRSDLAQVVCKPMKAVYRITGEWGNLSSRAPCDKKVGGLSPIGAAGECPSPV